MELIYNGQTSTQCCKSHHRQLRLRTMQENKFIFRSYLTNFVWE